LLVAAPWWPALAVVKRTFSWQLPSILAGVIMLIWIAGEIASIRGFHFSQVIYFMTGAAVIWYTPKEQPLSAVSNRQAQELRDE